MQFKKKRKYIFGGISTSQCSILNKFYILAIFWCIYLFVSKTDFSKIIIFAYNINTVVFPYNVRLAQWTLRTTNSFLAQRLRTTNGNSVRGPQRPKLYFNRLSRRLYHASLCILSNLVSWCFPRSITLKCNTWKYLLWNNIYFLGKKILKKKKINKNSKIIGQTSDF